MHKIFLDIGAYVGDTVRVVSDYMFDQIHCFEPVKKNYDIIEKKYNDKRIILHKYGMLDVTCKKLIYAPGFIGGSVFKEKRNVNNTSELCEFVKASSWFKKNISNDDFVIVKINVEGAEIDILNDLIDSGEYQKIKHMLISFDIQKVFGKEHEKDKMLLKFYKNNISNYFISGQIKYIIRRLLSKKIKTHYSDHEAVIKYWLKIIGE